MALTAGIGASQTGNVIYYNNTAAGSYSLSDAVTDTESGPASATFPLISTAGWTHPAQTVTSGTGTAPTINYSSSTYSFTSGASQPGTHSVVGTDAAGNAVTTALTFTKDTAVPTGGKLTINSTSSSAAGTTSFNTTGAFTIGLRTDYTDALSGIKSSVLTVASATAERQHLRLLRSPNHDRRHAGAIGSDHRLLEVRPDRNRPGREHRYHYDHRQGRPGAADRRCGHGQRPRREFGGHHRHPDQRRLVPDRCPRPTGRMQPRG